MLKQYNEKLNEFEKVTMDLRVKLEQTEKEGLLLKEHFQGQLMKAKDALQKSKEKEIDLKANL